MFFLHLFKVIFKTIGFIFIGRFKNVTQGKKSRWKVTSSKLITFSNISVKYESK